MLRATSVRSEQLQTLPAILLAHFASQNRSLLAANCLIEAVVDLYRQGITLDSIQFAMSMSCLESGSTLLSEQELDLVTARCGIIMLALQDVGCRLYPGVRLSDNTLVLCSLCLVCTALMTAVGKLWACKCVMPHIAEYPCTCCRMLLQNHKLYNRLSSIQQPFKSPRSMFLSDIDVWWPICLACGFTCFVAMWQDLRELSKFKINTVLLSCRLHVTELMGTTAFNIVTVLLLCCYRAGCRATASSK